MYKVLPVLLSVILFGACNSNSEETETTTSETENPDTLRYPQENHLRNVRQLTFGGDNAEAYFSFDDQKLTFQSNNPDWGLQCDQIFYFPLSDGDMKDHKPQMISTGNGRTTCAFFLPGDSLILYASTHEGGKDCPPVPPRDKDNYVWPIYNTYDIYVADLQGNIVKKLTDTPGYDAEATLNPQGDKIVFTSDRSGDLELYTMDIDGSNVKQITDELGYDGGAFFSPDGSKLVFRASRPKTPEAVKKYKDLLAQGLVAPTEMEIFVCNVDGSDLHQVTDLGKANWAPYFLPDGKKIIFSSNHAGTHGFEFNLYTINLDGTGLKQVTFDPVFDSFPMFSYDGKKIVFSSARNHPDGHGLDVFIADWVDEPTE